MAYIDEMKKQGVWLFRWRSFIPVALFLLLPIELQRSTYFMGSDFMDRLWEFSCFAVSLFGLGIRIATVGYVPDGTSGRTTSNPKATELNTMGMYSIVRHPLYLGNCVILTGIVLLPHSISLMVTCVFAIFLFYERIIVAEEAFLLEKFGDVFSRWASKTPVMIPKLSIWTKPGRPFSWNTVLKREYSGFFAITVSFAFIDALLDRFREDNWQPDWVWVAIFSVGLIVFVILRIFKKIEHSQKTSLQTNIPEVR